MLKHFSNILGMAKASKRFAETVADREFKCPILMESDADIQAREFIDNIYSTNELGRNNSNAIFKVKEMIDSISDTIPREEKARTLIRIAKIADIHISPFKDDGEKRLQAISSAFSEFADTSKKELDDLDNTIDSLTRQIETLREERQNKAELREAISMAIEKERRQINSLLETLEDACHDEGIIIQVSL